MKKVKMLVCAILLLLLLSACSEKEEAKEEVSKTNEDTIFEYYVDSLILSYDAQNEMYEFKRLVEESIDKQYRFKEGNKITEEGKDLYKLGDSSYMKLTMTRNLIENNTALLKEEKETLIAYYDETIEYVKSIRSYGMIVQAMSSNPGTESFIENYQRITDKVKENHEKVQESKEEVNKLLPTYDPEMNYEEEIGSTKGIFPFDKE